MANGADKPVETPNVEERSQEHAERAGLRYVSDDEPGITRKRNGEGFTDVRPNGERVTPSRREQITQSVANA